MKKWFLLLIGLLALTGCKNKNADKKKNSSEGLIYKLNSTEDGYEVSGIDDYSYDGINLVIPSSYNNLPIISIEASAFYSNFSLTSVQIPKSVKYIGESAFKLCINLSTIKFEKDSNLTKIYNYAFDECNSLRTITIPQSVTSIGFNSFADCFNLETIIFEKDSKMSIVSSEAFIRCKSLTSITIPKSVNYIGEGVFQECLRLQTVKFEEDSELTIMNERLFTKCRSLKSITLPNKLKIIGREAFSECELLPSIEIPSSVEEIKGYAFIDCTNLKEVKFEEDSKLMSISDMAFGNCISLNTFEMPESVMYIYDYVFSGCSSLTSIIFPNNTKFSSAGIEIFRYCDSLVYNEYGNCLYFGNEENPYLVLVKAKDYSITNASISNTTRSILKDAFSSCGYLKSIIIPGSVHFIGNNAFRYLTIYCESSYEKGGWSSSWNSNCTIYWGNQWEYVDGIPTLK